MPDSDTLQEALIQGAAKVCWALFQNSPSENKKAAPKSGLFA
jgi:hypothetical protein